MESKKRRSFPIPATPATEVQAFSEDTISEDSPMFEQESDTDANVESYLGPQVIVHTMNDSLTPVRLDQACFTSLRKFENYIRACKSMGRQYERNSLIDDTLKVLIPSLLLRLQPKLDDQYRREWASWSDDLFFHYLYQLWPSERAIVGSGESYVDSIAKLKWIFTPTSPDLALQDLVEKVNRGIYNYIDNPLNLAADVQASHVKLLIKHLSSKEARDFLPENLRGPHRTFWRGVETSSSPNNSFQALFDNMARSFAIIADAIEKAHDILGLTFLPRGSSSGSSSVFDSSRLLSKPDRRQPWSKKRKYSSNSAWHTSRSASQTATATTSVSAASPDPAAQSACNGCGRLHKGDCLFKGHPDFNRSKVTSWINSRQGKAWKEQGHDTLPSRVTLAGGSYVLPSDKRGKQECLHCQLATLCHFDVDSKELIPGFISVEDNSFKSIQVLLDPGSLQDNFIDCRIAESLKLPLREASLTVQSCFRDIAQGSKFQTSIKFYFYNELTKQVDIIVFEAYVIDTDAPIIGKHAIKMFDLHSKMYRQWWEGFRPLIAEASLGLVVSNTSSDVPSSMSPAKNVDASQPINSDVPLASSVHFPKVVEHEEDFILTEYSQEWEFSDNATLSDIPSNIQGTESFRTALFGICREFSDIFSRVVRTEPADIPPMIIGVDEQKWLTTKTQKSPRPTSMSQQLEIKRQIEKMIELKVIAPSTATQVSQVLLVPKPDDKWRFCVDFRLLNSCSSMSSWPLPNIEQTLTRIGHSKPCYFGILDLTSGYHQAPLASSSQIFTSFICFMGTYEWLRVAMGLKGAPSYFQQQLASIVLVGLIYVLCELYLDDVIIFASSEDEFLHRLRQVFERFRKYRITVNPDT